MKLSSALPWNDAQSWGCCQLRRRTAVKGLVGAYRTAWARHGCSGAVSAPYAPKVRFMPLFRLKGNETKKTLTIVADVSYRLPAHIDVSRDT